MRNQEYTLNRACATRKTVLVVEPDEGVASFLCTVIQDVLLHTALRASSSTEALALAQQRKIDLFLLADRTTPINGIELYDHLHNIAGLETVSAIILSTNLPCYQAEIAQRRLIGISEPFEIGTLLTAITNHLASSSQKSVRAFLRIENSLRNR